MQTNPKVTNIAIGGLGAAFTQINGTIMSSKWDVMEDPMYNGGVQQGLTGFILDPNSPTAAPVKSPANQQLWLPNGNGQQGGAYEPIVSGGADGRVHGGEGNYAGVQGSPLLLLTTNGAAGGVILREWP